MTNALLGQRLRQQRKKRGLTIEQLAEIHREDAEKLALLKQLFKYAEELVG